MKTYKNTGMYLNILLNELISNLHSELAIAGYPEIRPSHGWIFQYIKADGSRITELAQQAQITKQSMSVLVYQLEEWGYVSRKDDPTDKRSVLFKLTGQGKALQQTGRKINYEFECRWEKALGITNYKKFRQFMEKLTIDN